MTSPDPAPRAVMVLDGETLSEALQILIDNSALEPQSLAGAICKALMARERRGIARALAWIRENHDYANSAGYACDDCEHALLGEEAAT